MGVAGASVGGGDQLCGARASPPCPPSLPAIALSLLYEASGAAVFPVGQHPSLAACGGGSAGGWGAGTTGRICASQSRPAFDEHRTLPLSLMLLEISNSIKLRDEKKNQSQGDSRQTNFILILGEALIMGYRGDGERACPHALLVLGLCAWVEWQRWSLWGPLHTAAPPHAPWGASWGASREAGAVEGGGAGPCDQALKVCRAGTDSCVLGAWMLADGLLENSVSASSQSIWGSRSGRRERAAW